MIDRSAAGVFGQAGSGKTTLLNELIRPLTRVIIWDTRYNEFPTRRFESLEMLAEYLEDRGRAGGFFKVSYRPAPWEVEAFLNIVMAVGRMEPLTCVIEEARRLPRHDQSPALDLCLNEGRHHGVNLVFATLRPYQLEAEVRAQLTDVYAFFQTAKRDIDALREEMGDAAFEIPKLEPRYQYLHWNKFEGAAGITRGRTHPGA